MLQVFLSYAQEDADRVRKLCTELKRPGIEPWMDDELKLAGIWNDEITERLNSCALFVPILSRATQAGAADRFFRREWQLALDSQRRFLPVRLEECALPASLAQTLVAEFDRRQHEDMFPSYENSLIRILRFLHKEKRSGLFEETFSCLGPDNAGWRLGGWQLDDADSTGENSRSIAAAAALNSAQLLPQRVKHTAAVDIDLPDGALRLRYRRRLRLSTPVGGEATFQAAVDGEVVDKATPADSPEDDWITKSVAVPDLGATRATLEFTVSASCGMNYFPSAEAWVDDVRIWKSAT
jgi:hypothetical protein